MDTREENFSRDVYSKSMKAGKRTYFFDVKQTKNNEKYIVITESKKNFDSQDGSFNYEKHKIFLYKEDYTNFLRTLDNVIDFVKSGLDVKQEADNRRWEESDSSDQLKY